MNLWIIFLTGLTVGGLTCLAVQGGLLASVITSREEDSPTEPGKHALFATVVFLISKLIAYTILGAVLGSFGGALNISQNVQTIMQLLAGIYMVLVALNLLNIHPIFRYVIISPPRFLTKLVRNQSKSKDIFAPALLGAMTVFIPCGTTVAIEALAISSASPVLGASILAAFILGTIPLFLGIGFITSFLGEAFKSKFFKLAAALVIYLGVTSIDGSLVALGSPVSLQTLTQYSPITISSGEEDSNLSANSGSITQNPEILITSNGYSPNYIRVKKGEPVNLKLINKDAYSCAAAFRIPSLGLGKNVRPNQPELITFTPEKSGKIPFSCSMGMYRGVIEVI